VPLRQGGQQPQKAGEGANRARKQLKLLARWRRRASLEAFAKVGPDSTRALYAAHQAILDQVESGALTTVVARDFEAHCKQILEVHVALVELARICKRGSESRWPSVHQATNADAWQNTYEKLAMRISDGRVDLSRPLISLARVTARRFFLSEHRRQQRLSTLSELQLHRFKLGEGVAPEEEVETRRKRKLLRLGVSRLTAEGKLRGTDLEILDRRYVKDQSSQAVASSMGVSAQNVRQICTRRCTLLRGHLAGLGLEDETGGEL
jgi:hypothetical protein